MTIGYRVWVGPEVDFPTVVQSWRDGVPAVRGSNRALLRTASSPEQSRLGTSSTAAPDASERQTPPSAGSRSTPDAAPLPRLPVPQLAPSSPACCEFSTKLALPPSALVRELVDEFRPLAAARGIDLGSSHPRDSDGDDVELNVPLSSALPDAAWLFFPLQASPQLVAGADARPLAAGATNGGHPKHASATPDASLGSAQGAGVTPKTGATENPAHAQKAAETSKVTESSSRGTPISIPQDVSTTSSPGDFTTPPPCLDGMMEKQMTRRTKTPNRTLAKAMTGEVADLDRIKKMAERIRDPDYGLREFFDDSIASFPELKLFFIDVNQQASSAMTGDAEYQRTIGALFAVYWLLRLDTDGAAGFCYGVSDQWEPIAPGPSLQGKPFSQMDTDEKRAAFLEDMQWTLFSDLVKRAGCAPEAPGCTDRTIALLCLTAFHDIMKLPALQPVVQPTHAPYNGYEAGVRINDHDVALHYVLDHYPDLLPSYKVLDEKQKCGVLFTQGKMQFNHGWFVQAEAPPGGMLSKFKALLEAGADEADVNLYFLHWITDLAGAEARPRGGAEKFVLKLPRSLLASFLWSMPYLSNLVTMSETMLVEEYLVARWEKLRPDAPVPSGSSAIALMRLVVMAQVENPSLVVDAYHALSLDDLDCLDTELSRTGCDGQRFQRHVVGGGPAFLVYYGPALLQRHNKSKEALEQALHALCVVLRGARALWPVSPKAEGTTVTISIGEVKASSMEAITGCPESKHRSVWILKSANDIEGTVCLCNVGALNGLYMAGVRFQILDFEVAPKDEGSGIAVYSSGKCELRAKEFKSARRILVFTDMSTECDDECAFLWLLTALHRRGTPTTVELVQADSHVRYQWMSHMFKDKFAQGGEWQLLSGNSEFMTRNVKVNLYLAHSESREPKTIQDIQKNRLNVPYDLEVVDGKQVAVRKSGAIGGEDYTTVPGGKLDCIVVAAAIPDVNPEFFKRFEECKCVYVVGTPGGINCPMPSWVDLLAGFHRLAPVLYLTPQLTRMIRFPRHYVATNTYWNEVIRDTVWEAALTFMARRPELPPYCGNWGLVLRLNVANALFCRDWYSDVMKSRLDDAERPEYLAEYVNAYVERNSGYDRQLGAIVEELKVIGVDVTPAALGLSKDDFDERGHPCTQAARDALRDRYRKQLFEQVFTCVFCFEMLVVNHKASKKVAVDDGGFQVLKPKCGYTDPMTNLSEVFGAKDAVTILQKLPLRKLTPAYDVVGMICADAAMDEDADLDGGLDLLYDHADDSMGLGLLSTEQQEYSDHPIYSTLPQSGEGIYAAGPFT
mmetsp:Transcript_31167/g.85394  ORF Transcript_31167/g.85394 Transcript_31167/m.85394 type:complete len:1301 (-) Transcript_31167:128-4030(-)|eukprot:CAMPEP_0117480118 /NCGR_PEP_ID=MMETSP0784-20121206/12229_1 /TAXON_ID=39447 /ORGANISM="" /LENGTH=1300 /DNA_ID=CAMNT_0005274553 /DNA_START=1 /DNA_END=3903 /DNA_ORIENTATION=-